jgi:hypothetical protein
MDPSYWNRKICQRCKVPTRAIEIRSGKCHECLRSDYSLSPKAVFRNALDTRRRKRITTRLDAEKDLWYFWNQAESELGLRSPKLEYTSAGKPIDMYENIKARKAASRYSRILSRLNKIGHEHSRILQRYFTQQDYPELGIYFDEWSGIVELLGGAKGLDARKEGARRPSGSYLDRWCGKAKRVFNKALDCYVEQSDV